MIRAVIFALTLFLASSVRADTLSSDQEARYIDLARALRCLVCQNQSIEDSNAPLAADLRAVLRERLAAGDSDEAVLAFMVARYGDWILMSPPVDGRTYALWLGPFLLLILAGGAVAIYLRRQRRYSPIPQALTDEEQARLARLLGEKEAAQ